MDSRKLSRIIRNVEQSLECQDLSISAEEKAALIVKLYERADKDGQIPDKITTDRLVWLA